MSESEQSQEDRRSDECLPLLDASEPTVYTHNVFRITGLLVDATVREAKRRVDELKAAEEMGDAEDEHLHAFAAKRTPSVEEIQQASQVLQDPEKRFIHEFFWFWPSRWGEGKSDRALAALRNGDKEGAFAVWKEMLAAEDLSERGVAKHNLAVMYHLLALDREDTELRGKLSTKQRDLASKYWTAAFEWWRRLGEEEYFWEAMSDRIRALDNPRLTTGFGRRLRKTLPQALATINARLAVAFAEKTRLETAKLHVQKIDELRLAPEQHEAVRVRVCKPLHDRISSANHTCIDDVQREPMAGIDKAIAMLRITQPWLDALKTFFYRSDHRRSDYFDMVCETGIECVRRYVNETDEWRRSIPVLEELVSLAHSQETIDNALEAFVKTARNAVIHSFDSRLETLSSGSLTPAQLFNLICTRIIPHIESDARGEKQGSIVAQETRNGIAIGLRGFSVSVFNEHDDLDTAQKAIELAITFAADQEIKASLQESHDTLREVSRTHRLSQGIDAIIKSGKTAKSMMSALTTLIEDYCKGSRF